MSGGGAWEWFQYKFPPSETISVEYVCSYLLTDFSVTGYCSVAPVSVADQATVRYTQSLVIDEQMSQATKKNGIDRLPCGYVYCSSH